jgi:hypothetical protein
LGINNWQSPPKNTSRSLRVVVILGRNQLDIPLPCASPFLAPGFKSAKIGPGNSTSQPGSDNSKLGAPWFELGYEVHELEKKEVARWLGEKQGLSVGECETRS